MVRDGWAATTLITAASDQALRYAIDPGESRPLHVLAAGKAILASLTENELNQYFAETIREKFTEYSIVGEEPLRQELAKIREHGFAEAMEESTPGICSVASLIMIDAIPAGAIGVAVPTIRFTEELRIRTRKLLLRAAGTLSGQSVL